MWQDTKMSIISKNKLDYWTDSHNFTKYTYTSHNNNFGIIHLPWTKTFI